MITMQECAECEGIACRELPLCAIPSARHKTLLTSYMMNAKRGKRAVCGMIVGDLRRFIELGAQQRAADLLLVLLQLFLCDCPKGECAG